MKQFKFRGKSIYSGKFVYGDLSHYKSGSYVDNEAVYKNSVAQFVGYDKNGEEIYSDDEIRFKDWNRYCMAGTGIESAGDYFNFNDIGQKFDNVELVKENAEF